MESSAAAAPFLEAQKKGRHIPTGVAAAI